MAAQNKRPNGRALRLRRFRQDICIISATRNRPSFVHAEPFQQEMTKSGCASNAAFQLQTPLPALLAALRTLGVRCILYSTIKSLKHFRVRGGHLHLLEYLRFRRYFVLSKGKLTSCASDALQL
jgi:hypothetical protein